VITDDLLELGFERRAGELRAPDGSIVTLVPLNSSHCYRVTIGLQGGGAVHSLRVEAR